MNTLKNELKAKYSQIPNELVTDLTISAGALRVILYLFTKPDDWNVYNADICKQLNISEKTLTKYWNELLSSKWLRREKKQSKDGKFTGGYNYLIGNFTISEESSVSVKSGEHNNNIPTKKNLTNNKKINKKSEIVEYLKTLNLEKINKKSLNEWLDYKNWDYKRLGINKILSFLDNYSFDVQQEIVDNSIMNNYKGLFEPKGNNKKLNSSSNDTDEWTIG